jgi:hypothetical protein
MLPDCCGVYFLYDENDRVVYVGESVNIARRFHGGHDHKGRFGAVGFLRCDPCHRRRLESFYIAIIDPPLNHQSSHYQSKATHPAKPRSLPSIAKKIVLFVRSHDGCTKTQLHKAAGWKIPSEEVDAAIERIIEWKLVRSEVRKTPGRHAAVFFANTP